MLRAGDHWSFRMSRQMSPVRLHKHNITAKKPQKTRERERERERRERRERQTDTDRQTDRQTDRRTDRRTDRQTDRDWRKWLPLDVRVIH